MLVSGVLIEQAVELELGLVARVLDDSVFTVEVIKSDMAGPEDVCDDSEEGNEAVEADEPGGPSVSADAVFGVAMLADPSLDVGAAFEEYGPSEDGVLKAIVHAVLA